MLDIPLANPELYLLRMAKPLQEKLKVRDYIPQGAKRVLDIGCADGTVTIALARLYPGIHFVGIDRDARFIAVAQEKARAEGAANVEFRVSYIADLFDKPGERYDCVLFVSVLHEIYSYDGGMWAVVRALSGAHRLLNPGGDIVIRDMILPYYMRESTYLVQEMLQKIRAKAKMLYSSAGVDMLADFERLFGPIRTQASLNHFLLKYLYPENWDREGPENYIPVTFGRYEALLKLMDMEIMSHDEALLSYLRGRWKEDFSFTDHELDRLRSTGFVVARK